MKHEFHFLVTCLFLQALLSCVDEPINITCADPIGTSNESLESYDFTCFQRDYVGCFRFELDSNPPVIRSVYANNDPLKAPMLADVGKVQCLSEVAQKPKTAWSYFVEAKIHHGYAVRMADGTFGRLFIDSWETSGGQVTIVNTTRQYSY